MSERMTNERWDAVLDALSIGIDELNTIYEDEWSAEDPNHPDKTIKNAVIAYKILLKQKGSQRNKSNVR